MKLEATREEIEALRPSVAPYIDTRFATLLKAMDGTDIEELSAQRVRSYRTERRNADFYGWNPDLIIPRSLRSLYEQRTRHRLALDPALRQEAEDWRITSIDQARRLLTALKDEQQSLLEQLPYTEQNVIFAVQRQMQAHGQYVADARQLRTVTNTLERKPLAEAKLDFYEQALDFVEDQARRRLPIFRPFDITPDLYQADALRYDFLEQTIAAQEELRMELTFRYIDAIAERFGPEEVGKRLATIADHGLPPARHDPRFSFWLRAAGANLGYRELIGANQQSSALDFTDRPALAEAIEQTGALSQRHAICTTFIHPIGDVVAWDTAKRVEALHQQTLRFLVPTPLGL